MKFRVVKNDLRLTSSTYTNKRDIILVFHYMSNKVSVDNGHDTSIPLC